MYRYRWSNVLFKHFRFGGRFTIRLFFNQLVNSCCCVLTMVIKRIRYECIAFNILNSRKKLIYTIFSHTLISSIIVSNLLLDCVELENCDMKIKKHIANGQLQTDWLVHMSFACVSLCLSEKHPTYFSKLEFEVDLTICLLSIFTMYEFACL